LSPKNEELGKIYLVSRFFSNYGINATENSYWHDLMCNVDKILVS